MLQQNNQNAFRKIREEFLEEYANFREEMKEFDLAILGYRNCPLCKRLVTYDPKWNNPSPIEGPRPLCECHWHQV